MAIQAIGATSTLGATPSAAQTAKSGSAAERTDPAASTLVISRVTVTNPDGSTTTTITYADGHTETETTPAKAGAAQNAADGQGGKVTAVNLLV
jgi:hypothetical protein